MNFDLQGLADNVVRYLVTPLNNFGVGGFVFDVEGETTVNLTSEITDHFLEDNSSIQDHIAIKPKKITLKSYVGELVYSQESSATEAVQSTVRKLTVLAPYTPLLSQGAAQINEIRRNSLETGKGLNIKDALSSLTVNKTADYWAFVKNLVGQKSRQQQAYAYFKSLQEQKILVSVQTPFEYMTNMAIESITAIQAENTRFMSDFSVTLKQIRTAEILNVPAGKNYFVEGAAATNGTASVPFVDTPEILEPSSESLLAHAVTQYTTVKKIGPLIGTTPTEKQAEQYLENNRRIFGDIRISESLLQ